MHDPIAPTPSSASLADERASAPDERRLESRHPRVSIVVLSRGEVAELHRALALTLDAVGAWARELIVVRVGEARDLEALSAAYPELVFVEAPAGESIPDMRSRAIAITSGDVVLLREDAAIVDTCWLTPSVVGEATPVLPVERERARPVAVTIDSPAIAVPALILPREGDRVAFALPNQH